MKKPIPSESGLALTELLYSSEQETNSNLRPSHHISNPKAHRDAHNLAVLARNIQGGINTFKRVQEALIARHGYPFQRQLIREVRNGF